MSSYGDAYFARINGVDVLKYSINGGTPTPGNEGALVSLNSLGYIDNALIPGGVGTGSVTTVSIVNANGLSGTVANPTTTPAITLTLGAISPSYVTLLTSVAPAAPASGYTFYADANGRFSWIRQSDGFTRTWDSVLTGNRIFTLPDATTTIAGLSVAQTWTGIQTLTTPVLGVATATSLAIGGATIGANAAAITGTLAVSGNIAAAASLRVGAGTLALGVAGHLSTGYITLNSSSTTIALDIGYNSGVGITLGSGGALRFWEGTDMNIGSGVRSQITSPATATLQLGAADAASPIAQTLKVQSVVTGTANTAGQNWNLYCSAGTGTGAGGSWILNVYPAGGAGSGVNTSAVALTIASTKLATFTGNISSQSISQANGATLTLGNSAVTGLGAGVVAALTNATIVITDQAGQAYRIPCII